MCFGNHRLLVPTAMLALGVFAGGGALAQIDRSVVVGDFMVEAAPGILRVRSQRGSILWERAAASSPLADDWLQIGQSDLAIAGRQGNYSFGVTAQSQCTTDPSSLTITPDATPGATLLSWDLVGDWACYGRHAHLRFAALSGERLDFQITSDEPSFNTIQLNGASVADEHFYGFGLQPTYLDLKGHLVPIWTQEQGITRGREPFTSLVNLLSAGSAGTDVTSYMTAPHYLTSRLRSLFLKTTAYAEIDLRAPKVVAVRLYAGRMDGEILAGATPLALVSTFTEYAGRMRHLPDWFHQGAIVGLQGGTERVRGVLAKLRRLGTPLAGVWLQDWEGKRKTAIGSQLWWNWELSDSLYPGWADLVADLRGRGVRVLGYINPHLVDVAAAEYAAKRNLYEEARAAGYLVKNAGLDPYPVTLTAFTSYMVDLANPAARSWLKQVIKDNLLGAGLSGWMCDFSEALPADAVLAGGRSGGDMHHDYVTAWAQLNREAIREAGLEDEVVPFCRAGYTTSPRYARLFWQGDQMVTWDANDGLKSAVTGLISGGLSGYSLNHSDIGGYASLAFGRLGLTREDELLSRWAEFSAFTPAFRTHEGNSPDTNAQFYSSEASYQRFDRMSRLFASLFFYRKQLFMEAEKFGYPVVRALFLHYPEDARAYAATDEFLLGADILVAPVVDKGQAQRRLYLPKGRWVHIWSGQTYGSEAAGMDVEVSAPIGQPAAFYRAGSAVGSAWTSSLKGFGLL